jgi:hypothetical protein
MALQKTENHTLSQFVYHRTVKLSPLATTLGVTAGAELGVVVGALLGIPVAGAPRVITEELVARPTTSVGSSPARSAPSLGSAAPSSTETGPQSSGEPTCARTASMWPSPACRSCVSTLPVDASCNEIPGPLSRVASSLSPVGWASRLARFANRRPRRCLAIALSAGARRAAGGGRLS